jgi:signal transduction histidine kinase
VAGLALYRAAQEALTNARKHAPGAPVAVELDFDTGTTLLVVTNGTSAETARRAGLVERGGGFGLQGMRERVAQVGGTVTAGPRAEGWSVEVAVPS